MRRLKVWLQRGHCFRRTGSTGTAGHGTTEQAYVNDIAHRVAVLADREGHDVTVALADTYPSRGYDVFAAFHCDGSVSSLAGGASVGYRDASDRKIAHAWKARYAARGWPGGFRGDNYTPALGGYYGTRWANNVGIVYAYVLEFGFLTGRDDGPVLTSPRGRTIAALSVADTINAIAGGRPINVEEPGMSDTLERGEASVAVGDLVDALNAYARNNPHIQPGWAPLRYDDDGKPTGWTIYGPQVAKAVGHVKRLERFRQGNADTAEVAFRARVEARARTSVPVNVRLGALERQTAGLEDRDQVLIERASAHAARIGELESGLETHEHGPAEE